ncbi:MFS transporter [Treponema sp.]
MGVRDPTQLKLFVGLIQSIPAISLAIFAPIWGSLADNYGRKIMLLRAMFGGTIVMVLQGFAVNPWQFLALRTLQGCITGTVGAATVLVASVSPDEERGYSLGLLQMAIFMGSSLGPMFGGYVSEAFGHRMNFFATAVLLFLGGLVVAYFATDDFEVPENRKSIRKSLIPDFSVLAKSKALWALIAVVAADQVAGSIASPFLPLYIKQFSKVASNAASDTGLVLGLGALSSAVAAVLVGKVSYRLGYQRTLVVCILGAAIFTIPQAFVQTTTQLLVFRMISSFFIGGTMPSVNALIALRTPRGSQGSIYGLRSSIASLGAAIGPVLGSTLALLAGYSSVFLGTGLVLALTGTAVLVFVRGRKRDGAVRLS